MFPTVITEAKKDHLGLTQGENIRGQICEIDGYICVTN